MVSAREFTWRFFGSLVLAGLAVLVPLVVPGLLPSSASRSTTIIAVILAEIFVLLPIAILWVAMRSERTSSKP
jgi:hypothetical protein